MWFVVIEGLDGAGTTTQTGLVAEGIRQRGKRVVVTREPTDGPVGRMIRSVLRGEEGSADRTTLPWLFAADRKEHLFHEIEPAQENGNWVVCDRYYHSSLAYQSLELPLEKVLALNSTFQVPDLTIFLRVPVQECLRRIGARGQEAEMFERREELEKISSRYDDVISLLGSFGEPIVEVDGTADPHDIAAAILDVIDDRFL